VLLRLVSRRLCWIISHGTPNAASAFQPQEELCTGEEIAVKIQRPAVLSNVALDLHMLRSLAPMPMYQKSKGMNTDLVGLVDAWGEGFVNELDYRAEAKATTEFSRAMKERGLGSVFAPEVVEELSSMHVLTTKWVDGERLSDSDAGDVPRLCGSTC